ncbi:hypothetical protein PFISCL1PPCAC_5577, partial [Pristionchus fissidentatus]
DDEEFPPSRLHEESLGELSELFGESCEQVEEHLERFKEDLCSGAGSVHLGLSHQSLSENGGILRSIDIHIGRGDLIGMIHLSAFGDQLRVASQSLSDVSPRLTDLTRDQSAHAIIFIVHTLGLVSTLPSSESGSINHNLLFSLFTRSERRELGRT